MKEFDGDDDQLLAEYQQDIESGQLGGFNQELKDCLAELRRESWSLQILQISFFCLQQHTLKAKSGDHVRHASNERTQGERCSTKARRLEVRKGK